MYQPTTLKIYTNGALYIEHRPSTKRIAFSEPETGALVRKILVADWSTLKNILKAEGRVIAAVLTASQRDIEADMALRRKKAPTQWVVLEHPDIVPLIKTKITTREAGILNLGSVPVRVTITDKQILLHLASAQNMPNVIQQVVDAANWDKLVDAVADACKDAAQVIQDNPADYKIAQELISEDVHVCGVGFSRKEPHFGGQVGVDSRRTGA